MSHQPQRPQASETSGLPIFYTRMARTQRLGTVRLPSETEAPCCKILASAVRALAVTCGSDYLQFKG